MIILKGNENEAAEKKYRIIDAHCHIYPQKIAAKAVTAIGNFYGIKMSEDGTAPSLIAEGEKVGVERYVVHSTATTVHQVRSINEYIYGEMQAHPDIINMKETLRASLKAEEGSPFVDFTVVQDPDFPETSTDKFSDYIGKGKYVLVDFWSSACQPCWDVMPKLINVYNTYHGDQFDMLSVAVMDPPELSKESASQMGIVWNQVVNAKLIPSQVDGIDYAPYFMLFGPDGTLLKKGLTERQIEKTIKKALGV